MGDVTGIAWTDHTANFWWGCQKVSPGCEHCYAETLAVVRRKLDVWGPPKTTDRKRMKGVWTDVAKWNETARRDGVRRRMFVSSMADIFEEHPQVAPWRAEALALLASCTSLDVQLLTKRPQNIRAMVPPSWFDAWPAHVWVGTTVEDQRRAEERIPELLKVPARVRFLSMEPLLEAVDLKPFLPWAFWNGIVPNADGTPFSLPAVGGNRGVEWVIVGGESGNGARPFDLAWARSIVHQCRDAGVACFVKQGGDHAMLNGERVRFKAHHGADPSEWPADLRRQEFPR